MKPLIRQALAATLLLLLTVAGATAQWVTDVPQGESDGPENDHPAAADEWFWGQRATGLGHIPGDAVQKAIAKRQAMRTSRINAKSGAMSGQLAAAATNVQWKLIGPGNTGGRINAIAIHPTDPKIAYIGAANGGVWKTTDGGGSWTALTDNSQSLSMGALGIDANDPNTVYAGTGELPQSVDSYPGYGILLSHDGGKSWMTCGPINIGAYSRIIVDPRNSQIVYAAAGRSAGGVFRSTDGGKTWPRLEGGLPHGQVTDLGLSMNGDVPVLYAAVANIGIYRSMDGGDHWTQIHTFSAMFRMQLDVSPTDWKRVAAISVFSDGSRSGFEGSTDGGDHWASMGGNLGPSLFAHGGANPQGWYDIFLRIDPSNEDHVLVGGISVWSSMNFGKSWSDVGGAYSNGVHPDQHALEFAPSNPDVVYLGNDGGFYVSNDHGSNFSKGSGDLAITQFYDISVDQTTNDRTAGGTQDNGSQLGASTTNWATIWSGDGGYTIVDPGNATRIYLTTPNDHFPAVLEDGRYTPIGDTLSRFGDSTLWLNPILLDSKNNILYFGSDHLSQSTDHGASWYRGSKTPDQSCIQAIAAYGDARNVVVGTGAGHVYLTTDRGRRWRNVSTNLPARWITSIQYGSDTNSIYVAMSGFGGGHVFHSSNGGDSWSDVSGDLPDVPANDLVVDPENKNVLYLAMDLGVYLSPDGGGVWVPYGMGLPNVPVTSLDIHEANRVLRAGTHGRSIWEVPLTNDVPGITTPTQHTVWVMGDSASVRWHGIDPPVSIALSQDGGATWHDVAQGIGGTSYPIDKVEFSGSQNALVRVSNASEELTSPLFEIVQRKTGETLRVIAELPYTLYDVAWDPDNQVLWGTNWSSSSSTIYKIDPDNGVVRDSVMLPVTMRNLTGIKYDAQSKHLFVHQAISDGNSNWFEITTVGSIVKKSESLSSYGTGIYYRNDTLYLADRASSDVRRVLESDLGYIMAPLSFSRTCLYGPRCLAYNARLDRFMLAYTDFVGTNSTDARLTGSYVLFLEPNFGSETDAYYLQLGNDDVNIRGIEWDPRNGGKTAWVTYLESDNSAKLVKITLEDGPTYALNGRTNETKYSGSELGQNFPNPFNPSTVIPYTTAVDGSVEIRIMDNMGRVMMTSTESVVAGRHERRVDCSSLPSGSYTYELRINGLAIASRRMTLMK